MSGSVENGHAPWTGQRTRSVSGDRPPEPPRTRNHCPLFHCLAVELSAWDSGLQGVGKRLGLRPRGSEDVVPGAHPTVWSSRTQQAVGPAGLPVQERLPPRIPKITIRQKGGLAFRADRQFFQRAWQRVFHCQHGTDTGQRGNRGYPPSLISSRNTLTGRRHRGCNNQDSQ